MMRACLAGVDQRLYLTDVSVPVLGKCEVLLKIHATAVNRADLYQTKGRYDPPKGVTNIIGLECVGEVVAVGAEVTRWGKGDKVMALLAGGGYAEYTTVFEQHIIRIPDGMDYIHAAAIPEAWITAYQVLVLVGQARTGETILAHAGASGVGTALIQLARLRGIRCLVTVGSSEKAAFCSSLGAYRAFNYKEKSFVDDVMEATEGRGVDLLLDCVGGSFFCQNSQVVATDGRWVHYGTLGGTKVEDGDMLGLVLKKRMSLIGTTLRNRSVEYKSKLVESFADMVLPHFIDGTLKPVVNKVFPFEKVNEAHDYVAAGKNIGKVIIEVVPQHLP